MLGIHADHLSIVAISLASFRGDVGNEHYFVLKLRKRDIRPIESVGVKSV